MTIRRKVIPLGPGGGRSILQDVGSGLRHSPLPNRLRLMNTTPVARESVAAFCCMASRFAEGIMDKIDLSLKMRRLAQWVDSQRQPPSLIRKEFRGTPFGHCYLTMDVDRQTP